MLYFNLPSEKAKKLIESTVLILDPKEINGIIDAIIESYDTHKVYLPQISNSEFWRFKLSKEIAFFSKYEKVYKSITESIEGILPEARKLYDKEVSEMELFDQIDCEPFDSIVDDLFRDLFKAFFAYFRDRAIILIKDRKNHRAAVGSYIDLTKCAKINTHKNSIIKHQSKNIKINDVGIPCTHLLYQGDINYKKEHVEFYMDGAWGVATLDGKVLISNHLSSSIYAYGTIINKKHNELRLIKDADSGYYGIIEIIDFIEVVPFEFDMIQTMEYDDNPVFSVNIGGSLQNDRLRSNSRKFRGGKWGAFSIKGSKIIDVKYDNIRLLDKYIECGHDGDYEVVYDENDKYDEGSITYIGEYDLFDKNGKFIIGGYRYSYIFNTIKLRFENPNFQENCYKGYEPDKYHLPQSLYVMMDSNFNSIYNNNGKIFSFRKCNIIKSFKDLVSFVPKEHLFQYNLEQDQDFLYIYHENEEEYLISEFVDDYKKEGIFSVFHNDKVEDLYYSSGKWIDHYFIDDIVEIIHLGDDHLIDWRVSVNECQGQEIHKFYRIGSKVGIYSANGLQPAIYDAITFDINNNCILIAIKTHIGNADINEFYNKHNFNMSTGNYIEYFKLDLEGNRKVLSSNWKEFDPRKYCWFPEKFKEQEHLTYDYYDSCSDIPEHTCEWTDEDAWDAMTDGMYGDYPGPGWDPEMFGY